MKYSTPFVVLSFAAAALAQSGPSITTPAAYIQCQPVLLTVSGSNPPFILDVIPGGEVSAAAIEELTTTARVGSYTWNVNLPAGTNITIRITDSTGQTNYNTARVIQAGSSSACLSTSATASGVTGGSSTAASASAVTSTSAPITSTTVVTSAGATATAASGVLGSSLYNINGSTTTTAMLEYSCARGLPASALIVAALNSTTLSEATMFFSNWTAAAPGPVVSYNGTGSVGASRTWTYDGNVTLEEVLQATYTNLSSGALYQRWSYAKSTPLALTSAFTVFNYTDGLTVYTNTSSSATTVQYFAFGCFNDQTPALSFLSMAAESFLSSWQADIMANTTSTATKRCADPSHFFKSSFGSGFVAQ